MKQMKQWWRTVRGFFRRDSIEADLAEELRTHLEMKAAASGDPHAARRQFGSVALHLEDARAAWGWPRLDDWLRDIRYSFRLLLRRPTFTTTVILTLALGIGASSTIFSLADAVLIRGLSYPDSSRLVVINESSPFDRAIATPVSPARLEDWRRMSSSLEAIGASYRDTWTDTSGPLPERIIGAYVSPGYFQTLATPPALGRFFSPDEERFGGPLALVISDGFWRRRFAADPQILGRTISLSNQTYVITGVMPPSFQHPSPTTEAWAAKQANSVLMGVREARFYNCIARLKPGVTTAQAEADLAAVQNALGRRYPKTDAGWGAIVAPLKDRIIGNTRRALWLLLGSVFLLLLIACANVACLLLVQLNSRAAEIATRCSLGAARSVILRQLFVEGLAYAAAGGLLGLALTVLGIRLLRQLLPDLPRISELAIDARILALLTAITLLSAILFSLAPMLQSFRRDAGVILIRAGRSNSGTRQRLPRILVSAQLALATSLLIGAGLFLRSLVYLEQTQLGLQPANVLTLRIGATFNEVPDTVVQRHQRILDALAALPGVTSVAMSAGLPGSDSTWRREFDIVGEPDPAGVVRFANWRFVTSTYFHTLGIPILQGETCRMASGTPRLFDALVNRSFVNRYFPGRSPIGQYIAQGPSGQEPKRIVGIVGDVREDGPAHEPAPMIYGCGYLRYWPDADYILRTAGDPAAIAASMRQAIRAVEPGRPVYSVRPLSEALYTALSQNRVRTLLVAIFSLIALTLAAIGLYGVMAYMVTQRSHEIGIRMALGARPTQVLSEILRSGAVLVAAGAAAGIALAGAASRFLETLLYGVRPSDSSTYVAAAAVLCAAALLACLIPGYRATAVDPTTALRQQ